MPSLSQQWRDTKAAWDDDTSNASPGARFGLMFDPLAYAFGDKYRKEITGHGDKANLELSKLLGTDDRGGWAANKPASTIGLMAAAYYGGGAMMGGAGGGSAGGGMFGSSTGGGNLGLFSNGGQGGMAGVGSGNAGSLFANTGINTGGVGGVGGTGAQGGLGQLGMQDWMKLGQGMPGMGGGQQQQQEQSGPKPYLYRGQIVWM